MATALFAGNGGDPVRHWQRTQASAYWSARPSTLSPRDLFGSGVGNSPGERLLRPTCPLGESEVAEIAVLAPTLAGDQHVAGLYVSVDEATGVRLIERLGNLPAEVERAGGLQRRFVLQAALAE